MSGDSNTYSFIVLERDTKAAAKVAKQLEEVGHSVLGLATTIPELLFELSQAVPDGIVTDKHITDKHNNDIVDFIASQRKREGWIHYLLIFLVDIGDEDVFADLSSRLPVKSFDVALRPTSPHGLSLAIERNAVLSGYKKLKAFRDDVLEALEEGQNKTEIAYTIGDKYGYKYSALAKKIKAFGFHRIHRY